MAKQCKVCGEEGEEINWHYGAITCFACAKFFYRSRTAQRRTYTCSGSSLKNCNITSNNRTCQYCRYQNCLNSGMNINLKSQNLSANELIKSTACKVCSEPSSGIHFGVTTCEACKGFFLRSINQKTAQPRMCINRYASTSNSPEMCEINKKTRSKCRYCRLKKCVNVGMSIELVHLGRQSNIFKHDVIENSKYSLPTKQKASASPQQEVEQKSKRAKLSISDNSLDLTASSSTSLNLPISNQSQYFETSNNILPILDRSQIVDQPTQSNITSYNFSAYNHFSQMYSTYFFENMNQRTFNRETNAPTPYFFGNQINYNDPAQYNQYVN